MCRRRRFGELAFWANERADGAATTGSRSSTAIEPGSKFVLICSLSALRFRTSRCHLRLLIIHLLAAAPQPASAHRRRVRPISRRSPPAPPRCDRDHLCSAISSITATDRLNLHIDAVFEPPVPMTTIRRGRALRLGRDGQQPRLLRRGLAVRHHASVKPSCERNGTGCSSRPICTTAAPRQRETRIGEGLERAPNSRY